MSCQFLCEPLRQKRISVISSCILVGIFYVALAVLSRIVNLEETNLGWFKYFLEFLGWNHPVFSIINAVLYFGFAALFIFAFYGAKSTARDKVSSFIDDEQYPEDTVHVELRKELSAKYKPTPSVADSSKPMKQELEDQLLGVINSKSLTEDQKTKLREALTEHNPLVEPWSLSRLFDYTNYKRLDASGVFLGIKDIPDLDEITRELQDKCVQVLYQDSSLNGDYLAERYQEILNRVRAEKSAVGPIVAPTSAPLTVTDVTSASTEEPALSTS